MRINTLAKRTLGWEPQVSFQEGLQRTVAWYLGARSPEEAGRVLRQGEIFKRNVGDTQDYASRLLATAPFASLSDEALCLVTRAYAPQTLSRIVEQFLDLRPR